MAHWGRLFLFYFLLAAVLAASVFLFEDMTLFYEGLIILGVIFITTLIVVVLQMHQ